MRHAAASLLARDGDRQRPESATKRYPQRETATHGTSAAAARVLALQWTLGNAAVSRMLRRVTLPGASASPFRIGYYPGVKILVDEILSTQRFKQINLVSSLMVVQKC